MSDSKPPIDLDSHRPHRVGQFICVECAYSAISVVPLKGPFMQLECPMCGKMKGVHILHGELSGES